MQLPAALQPWRPWLDWFPVEQALALGPVLQHLQTLVGEFRGRQPAGEPEPAGVDDLRRRGPYHRLLLSEWALSDALPDEFLRRAAGGEHLFLAPRLERDTSDALCVAVFDPGPAQLGAARLVHLALWILLARRARQAGNRFAWGTCSAPGELADADSADRLRQMLARRRFSHATDAEQAAWGDALAAPGLPPGERWYIGAADDAIAPQFTHRVSVERTLEGDLAVTIASAHVRRERALPAPARSLARLVRGQFELAVIEAPASHDRGKLAITQPPLIGPRGQSLAVPVLGEHAALVFRLPPRRGKSGAPRKVNWTGQRDPLCAALTGKHFGALLADDAHVFFWQMESFRTQPRPPRDVFMAPPGRAHWLPCLWLNGGGLPHHLVVCDAASRLVEWASAAGASPTGPQPRVVDENVLALGRCTPDRFVYLRHGGQLLELMLSRENNRAPERLGSWHVPTRPDRAFIAGRPHGFGWRGAWAAPEADVADGAPTPWAVYQRHDNTDKPRVEHLVVRAGARVVGLIADPDNPFGHSLVALSHDRRDVLLVRGSEQVVVHSAAAPIATVSVATDADLIALVTMERQLVLLGPGGGETSRWTATGWADADG